MNQRMAAFCARAHRNKVARDARDRVLWFIWFALDCVVVVLMVLWCLYLAIG
jgi:hypothetical protein